MGMTTGASADPVMAGTSKLHCTTAAPPAHHPRRVMREPGGSSRPRSRPACSFTVRWEQLRRRPMNSSPEHLDVLIVGAGLSGIGAARYPQAPCPRVSVRLLHGRDGGGRD